jgi:hypothetical protein
MVSLKQFVFSQAYAEFKTYLEEQIAQLHRSMESARTPDEMYRLQGQVAALRRLLSLKETLTEKERRTYG